jgi:hypothetical protein
MGWKWHEIFSYINVREVRTYSLLAVRGNTGLPTPIPNFKYPDESSVRFAYLANPAQSSYDSRQSHDLLVSPSGRPSRMILEIPPRLAGGPFRYPPVNLAVSSWHGQSTTIPLNRY